MFTLVHVQKHRFVTIDGIIWNSVQFFVPDSIVVYNIVLWFEVSDLLYHYFKLILKLSDDIWVCFLKRPELSWCLYHSHELRSFLHFVLPNESNYFLDIFFLNYFAWIVSISIKIFTEECVHLIKDKNSFWLDFFVFFCIFWSYFGILEEISNSIS